MMPRSSILAMLGKNWAAVTGHVRLHVTHTPCLSCVWAMASWFFMMSGEFLVAEFSDRMGVCEITDSGNHQWEEIP